MLAKFQRFNVLIGIVLGIAIASLMLLMPEGLGRLAVFAVAAGVFCLCAFAWKPKPPTTLNSFALLAILGLPEWRFYILLLVHVAALVAIAFIVRSCIIFERRLRGECNI